MASSDYLCMENQSEQKNVLVRVLYYCGVSYCMSSDCTVKTRNKAKVGKRRIIPYSKSFPCGKSRLFVHGKTVSTEKCTSACLYMNAESLIASHDCIL